MGSKKRHTLLWLVAFVFLLAYRILFPLDSIMTTGIVNACIDIFVLWISAFIVNKYLVSRILYQKGVFIFICALIVVIYLSACGIQLLEWVWYQLYDSLDERHFEVFYSFRYQIFNSYLVVIVGCVIICANRLFRDYRISKKKNEVLEIEKIQTELKFLKAQMNPHFLFNSINSIYAEIDKSNTKARDIVLKFSEMLRYQLYDCNVERIPIEKEIAYIRNFIDLQKLRRSNDLKINLEIKEVVYGFDIAPILLIPFIENAFKYLSRHEQTENFLTIKMNYQQHAFDFFCANSKDETPTSDKFEEGGIGIENVKRRLELLYPNAYELIITDNPNVFNVKLKIKIA